MDKAFDKASVIKTLRDGITKGLWTLEDLDIESQDSRYWRKEAKRNVPVSDFDTACFMKPHKNLLRESNDEPIQSIEVIPTNTTETSSRSSPENEGERPHVFLHKDKEDHPAISVEHLPW